MTLRRADDERWMRRALALARRGLGEANPNPAVGCVIVRNGRVVGEGFHLRAGEPHAEALALRRAGERARGATLYVTLEPCVPYPGKRTPPCARALVAAGVRRVVVALRDPNPAVQGRGLRTLRRAGVEVVSGVREAEAAEMLRPYVVAQRTGRPHVLLKVAATLDGRIATARGHSKWITGPRERAQARALRREHDGVLVGIGTALLDDPRLLPSPPVARPFFRVVLDSRLRLPLSGRLARSARRTGVIVFGHEHPARRRALEAAGVRVHTDGRRSGPLDLRFVLRTLWRDGLRTIMVEGGSEVLGSFLAERLFDDLVLFRGPLLLGGRGSRGAFGGPDPATLGQALRLERRPPPPGALYELWRPIH